MGSHHHALRAQIAYLLASSSATCLISSALFLDQGACGIVHQHRNATKQLHFCGADLQLCSMENVDQAQEKSLFEPWWTSCRGDVMIIAAKKCNMPATCIANGHSGYNFIDHHLTRNEVSNRWQCEQWHWKDIARGQCLWSRKSSVINIFLSWKKLRNLFPLLLF